MVSEDNFEIDIPEVTITTQTTPLITSTYIPSFKVVTFLTHHYNSSILNQFLFIGIFYRVYFK